MSSDSPLFVQQSDTSHFIRVVKIHTSTSLGELGGTDGYFRAVIDASGCLYSVVEQILTSFTSAKITAPCGRAVLDGNVAQVKVDIGHT